MPDKPTNQHYENNPFFIASNGITLLFSLAQGVAIMLVILSILGLFSGAWSPDTHDNSASNISALIMSWSFNDWLLVIGSIAVIVLAIAMISALLGGVSAYTSSRLALGKEVKISVAFQQAFEHLWAYLWLQAIIFVKLLLWSLLFIIPGLIMSVRYSLAGVAFFDEKKNLRGDAAIKESLRLTKGAWLTTYASNALFNILTLGSISSLVSTGANAVLYKQFDKKGDKKPDAHWLSWLTLVLPIAIVVFAVVATVIIAIVVGLVGVLTL